VFKGRQFDKSVILLCVRWYLAYNLSLRDLEEMMAERWGILMNGRLWRLYHRETSFLLDSFFEVNLPALLEQEDLEAFITYSSERSVVKY